MMRNAAPLTCLLALLPRVAFAEGSQELGSQFLSNDTVAWVDILDPTTEVLRWDGMGSVTIADANGVALGTLASGGEMSFLAQPAGAFHVTFSADQRSNWDLSVQNATVEGGRLYAYYWNLDSGTWDETGAFNGSFYALVGAGGPGYDGVIEMKAEGLQGNRWQMAANGVGVEGDNAGRSVPEFNHTYVAEYPIYLNAPAIAHDNVMAPAVSEFRFTPDDPRCGGVAPGYGGGTFTFTSATPGTYHISCDLNGDGVFDFSTNADLTKAGYATAGENEVWWDGNISEGRKVAAGSYTCKVTVTVGEFHFIASDIETSFPGLRMFRVRKDLSRDAMKMVWNDEMVVSPDVPMPDGQMSFQTSGAGGLASGAYNAAATANTNARAWGDFSENGKGNISLLDTYAWIQDTTSTEVALHVVDASVDENGDGIPDDCLYGYYYGGCSTAPRASWWPGLLALFSAILIGRRSTKT